YRHRPGLTPSALSGLGPREAKYDAFVVAWRDVLRWQFDLAWSLLELYLNRLEPSDFLWQPAPGCFTVHPTADGGWEADWADPERTVAHMVAWVNAELMKNAAEIGQLRLLHAAV